MPRILPPAAMVVLLLYGNPVAADPRFRVVDLGLVPGASHAEPTRFGAGGAVLGRFDMPGTFGGHAGMWTLTPAGDPQLAADLGGLPGFDWSHALARNSAGWIVGHSNTGDPQPRAVLWRDNQVIDIEQGADGNANVYALDVNDAGQIVGFMTKSGGGGQWEAVMWTEDANHPGRFDRSVLPLHPSADPLGAWTEAQAVDAMGRVFGRTNLGGSDRATIWLADAARTPVLLEPLEPGYHTMPGDWNESGVAVGYTMAPFGLDRATVWANDDAHTPSELPRWPGCNHAAAQVIDPGGTSVLGMSSLVDFSVFPWITLETHVVLWRDGAVWDMNQQLEPTSSEWIILACADMNADGWIAATAERAGVRHAVLLLPVSDVAGVASTAGSGLSLAPPYPNPSRGEVTLRFALPQAGPVTVSLVDAQGRTVATPLANRLGAGTHVARWNGRDGDGARLAPGVYFATLDSAAGRVVRRITLLP